MITFYYTGPEAYDMPEAIICRLICDDQKYSSDNKIDRTMVMSLSRGKMNPARGFIMLSSNSEILKDYFDLVDWIDRSGLRPC